MVNKCSWSQSNIVEGLSTQGLEMECEEIIEDGEYDYEITLCFDCGQQAENPGDRLCIFCKNSEPIWKCGEWKENRQNRQKVWWQSRQGDMHQPLLGIMWESTWQMWTKADVNSPMFWPLLCQLLKKCSNWQQRTDIWTHTMPETNLKPSQPSICCYQMSTPVKPELWGLQLMLKAPEVGKALQGVVATRPARQMRASASRQNWCAILDAMAEI